DSAREMDELIVLNRGAAEGEHTEPVKQLVAAAVAGKKVSAIEYTKSGAAFRRDDVGAGDRTSFALKDVEIGALENAKRRLEFENIGLQSEVAEPKAKLDETLVRHQRRLFRRVLDAMQKAEASDIPAKEKRSLHNDVIVDLTEFVRSAARDGLS